ncbi:MAG TPA: RHS repeat-associated core domain-containing protein, partial [Longimicrobium sp.]
GFWSEGVPFYLEPAAKPNHQAVYRCRATTNNSRFLSAEANCVGHHFEGLLGYAANSQVAGTTPLYAFEHGYPWNYFYTTDPVEAQRVRDWGWRDAGIHAYVYTTRERSARAAVQRTVSSGAQRWTLNSAESAPGFAFNGVGFYLEERGRYNHQPVYGCAANSGGGQFLSSDANCAGQGAGRMLGHAANVQMAGTVALRAFERGYWNYHYTTTTAEAQAAINAGWRDAGIHAYVYVGDRLKVNTPQPLRFTGREYDEDTGLYNYRARWYDPHLGRFMSEDPIGLAGGINPHAYVGNDPVNYSDPSGLGPCPEGTPVTVDHDNETCREFTLDPVTVVGRPRGGIVLWGGAYTYYVGLVDAGASDAFLAGELARFRSNVGASTKPVGEPDPADDGYYAPEPPPGTVYSTYCTDNQAPMEWNKFMPEFTSNLTPKAFFANAAGGAILGGAIGNLPGAATGAVGGIVGTPLEAAAAGLYESFPSPNMCSFSLR